MRQISLIAAAIAALTTTVSMAAAAHAETACFPRTDLVEHLARNFHEEPTAIGVADNGSLLEVFASKDGETWTVAVSLPNGTTCLVATGQQWQEAPSVAHADQGA
jgi:hypothetical protein